MKTLFLLFAAMIAVGPSNAADRRPDPAKLVIMTFNAEFLWDGVPPEEGNADFPWRDSQTEAEEHMEQIAEVVIHHNPDIINLVEVENTAALNTFNERFLPGRGYAAYLIKGTTRQPGRMWRC